MTHHITSKKQAKALALISGGLDSLLAAKMILEQGVHVEGINFYTGFCVEGHTSSISNKKQDKPRRNNALWCAEQLGIKLHIVDVVEEYKDIVINPKFGRGANLNPCTDCKGFMLRQALQWIEDNNFDFIITGEVIGQRPMSQTGEKMRLVVQNSGVEDRLLRPLCAKSFEPTLAEREGWVNREELGHIIGRSRKPQIELAEKWQLEDYAQPAGGCCFLTDKNYSRKMVDLWQARGERRYELDDVILLKVGRHIRPKDHYKLIVCRDDSENNFARGYRNRYTHLYCTNHDGPFTLVDGDLSSQQDKILAARITARFSKGKHESEIDITLVDVDNKQEILKVQPLPAEQLPQEWYV